MRNKQLFYLFICSAIILFVGMGLFPILPLYAAEFGATRTTIGIYFALVYVSNAAGYMSAGRLADRLTRKGALVSAALLGLPALLLMGQATALWQVVVLTCLVWFSGGTGLALVNVLAGLHVDDRSRGKSFSLLSLAYPLGAILGGAVTGQLIRWQGYPLMFGALSVVWAILPAIGFLAVKDKAPAPSGRTARGAQKVRLGPAFQSLLVASLLSATAINASRLGTPLSMQALDFSPDAVAGTALVSGLVAMPFTLLIGTLSDRLGRKRFLMLTYSLTASGALVLSVASQVWHFWLAASFILIAMCAERALASALATDILPSGALNHGLPRLSAMNSVAGIVSFASAGYVMDTLGAAVLYLAASSLAAAAVLQLIRLRPGRAPEAAIPPALPAAQSVTSGC